MLIIKRITMIGESSQWTRGERDHGCRWVIEFKAARGSPPGKADSNPRSKPSVRYSMQTERASRTSVWALSKHQSYVCGETMQSDQQGGSTVQADGCTDRRNRTTSRKCSFLDFEKEDTAHILVWARWEGVANGGGIRKEEETYVDCCEVDNLRIA